MKKKLLFFALILLLGTVILAAASAAGRTITFDSTASVQLPKSFVKNKTENNITYYKDEKNKISCGYRVSEGQVSLADVKATLKKAGYTGVKTKTINGAKVCSGTRKGSGTKTIMSYFNTKASNFVMLAFTYDTSKAKAKTIVDTALASLKVEEPAPAPAAPPFAWTGKDGKQSVTSVRYGGRDLVKIYLMYTPGGNNDYVDYYLKQYESSMKKLTAKKVKVLVCLLGSKIGTDVLKDYTEKFSPMVFGTEENTEKTEMYTALERMDYTGTRIPYPVVFLRSRNNRLRHYEMGSLDNAKTIVKKALAMASDNTPVVPPDPHELEEPEEEEIYLADYGKYRLSGGNAIFIGLTDNSLTELEIPPQIYAAGGMRPVTEIAAGACRGMKNLKQLQIDSGVAKIGKNAFRDCPALDTIVFLTSKLKDSSVGANAFLGCADKPSVKCPSTVLKTYKTWLIQKGIPENAKFTGIRLK